MPQYKLIYFNLRARGEISRLLFAAGSVPYEDSRVEHSRWPDLKPSTPFGQLPVLEVDGVRLCQSKAIARYLALKFGLAGKTEIEKARADMLVDCMDDILKPTTAFFFEKDKAKQEELQATFDKETLPALLLLLEKLLVENKGGNTFFVGDSLTWADLTWIDLCSWLGSIGSDSAISSVPKLAALRIRVEALPMIAEWIKKRPVTQI